MPSRVKIKQPVSDRVLPPGTNYFLLSLLDLFNDIEVKWYKFNEVGDDKTFLSNVGNCTGDMQAKLGWVEIITSMFFIVINVVI